MQTTCKQRHDLRQRNDDEVEPVPYVFEVSEVPNYETPGQNFNAALYSVYAGESCPGNYDIDDDDDGY